MLQSAAIRSLFHSATQCSRSPIMAQRLIRPSSSLSPLAASYRVRFGAQSLFAKSLQVQTFASIPGRDNDDEQQLLHTNSGKSKKQQIQELMEENEALKKELEKLKAEIAKKPNKFMGTLQQYGVPFLVWWTSLYLASGVSIYVALDTGLVSGASIIDFIMQIGLDKFIDPARLDPTYGNIAIAVIVNECLEVIRFPITLATLPYIKRIFSRKKVEEAAK
ncbi:hypothetical protein JG687_00007964 [Phytophthora cactorum]|uniref:DUF1279 domain-containing protein n=1 Tax=Phytophthora cactorum TaxID=29920 RepID=A0A329T0D4_9STRA|nr:hypothetical protein Pcac1_g3818 [Phytophthora cactorum]KAG2832850.1 hypothetical protein PC112_g6752 [Phytophthora cactorum]KAG2835321.1 hypothetical protein PC111_g5497 [Phytophthora cactorum]KAG2862925.1 hypothetical protein PC113_g5889 [Phytophthora cactorum]KAG2918326.1 hypothetical protein PC114_g6881 [Phytophthora cactorum]